MTDLKPCPFCGGEAKVFHYSSAIRDEVWRVVCDRPFCAQGPDGYTEAEAIAAWNTRDVETCENVDDHKTVWFICSVCGYTQKLSRTRSYCPNCGAKVVSEWASMRRTSSKSGICGGSASNYKIVVGE